MVAPFDAMLLALIEDWLRSDASEFMQDVHGLLQIGAKEVFKFVNSRWPKILEKISAPGDCNQAFRQSSGALAVQIGLVTVANGGGNRTSFPLRLVINFNIGGCVWLVRPDANRRAIAFDDSFLATLNCAALCR
jgi:hypothetical protein